MKQKSSLPIDPDFRDSARRASDIVNSWYTVEEWESLKNKFVAIRLSDGGSDGNLYDSKRDAVRHTDESLHAYVCYRNLGPQGANPRDMAIFLQMNRNAWKDPRFHGLTDPDGNAPDVAPTSGQVDSLRHIVDYRLSDIATLEAMARFKEQVLKGRRW